MSALASPARPSSIAALACSHRGVSIRAISASVNVRSAMRLPCRSGSLPRQPEHPLGDDVALDLAGPAGDRPAEGPHPLRHPGTLAPHLRPEAGAVEAGRAERGRAELQAALHALAPEQLEERMLGRRLPGHELGEPAVAYAQDRPRVD